MDYFRYDQAKCGEQQTNPIYHSTNKIEFRISEIIQYYSQFLKKNNKQ